MSVKKSDQTAMEFLRDISPIALQHISYRWSIESAPQADEKEVYHTLRACA